MSFRSVADLIARPNPRSGRVRLISANWKMNHNHLEAIATVQKLFHLLRPDDYRFAELSIHPPFTDLRSLQLTFEADRMPFSLGAQNCHEAPSGAFTGEISARMLARLGVAYVIVGHSERRHGFGEGVDLVAKKAAAVAESGMIPIVCVGETATERAANASIEVVQSQLDPVIAALPVADLSRLVIAYEPVWAIGSGTPADPDDAAQMAANIRAFVSDRVGEPISDAIRVQYGGSVGIGNAKSFLEAAGIDGLLIGSASLDAEKYALLIQGA
ncbi:MAG: triose-phosphate isomerase [Ferrimicrobium sp.]